MDVNEFSKKPCSKQPCGGHVDDRQACARNMERRILKKPCSKQFDGGHVEIVKLCKEYGATNFKKAMLRSSLRVVTLRSSNCA